MKKINNKGFVLAETLVVAVFLLVIFGMLYSNFYPLIGEYEKRETYDDVDSKYAIYWLKRLIEDSDYQPTGDKKNNLEKNNFMRFDCSDMQGEKNEVCQDLVKELQVEGCDNQGTGCNIFITNYNITTFKDTVTGKFARYKENCFADVDTCKSKYVVINKGNDPTGLTPEKKEEKWQKLATKSVFNSGMEDYIFSLPNYKNKSANGAKYRVIASFHHIKDNNNFYSYATIEVDR